MASVLSADQVERYHRDGILFPVPVLSPGEAARFRAAFEELAARLGGRPVAQALGHTQLYFRWAYDLATHPAVLDAVERLGGQKHVSRSPPPPPVTPARPSQRGEPTVAPRRAGGQGPPEVGAVGPDPVSRGRWTDEPGGAGWRA